MFRDRFGACHVVTGATKSARLASKLSGCLYRHTAYIVVHGGKKRKGNQNKRTNQTNKKSLKSVFVDKQFAFRGKVKQGSDPKIPIEKFLVRQVCEVCVVESNQDECSHELCPPCIFQWWA